MSRRTADGPVLFWVVNQGDEVKAVSLRDSGGQVVAELSDVRPAMTRPLVGNVDDGEYELVCQPVGDEGVRTIVAGG